MAEYRRERVIEEHDSNATVPVTPAEPIAYSRTDPPDGYRRVEREVVREDTPEDRYYRRRVMYARAVNVVWTIIGLIEALIGLRVLLRLIAANPGNPFVHFVYALSGVFVNPFLGIVHDPSSGGAVLEVNSLIAMLVYLLIGWAVVRLIWLLFDTTAPTPA
ncbi:MAG TPA: hypothetical protein VFN57_05245 [Thermomicrobiaceae bacterium]|nr:hypothetical protein [Thermomicrobiaceae bacterium]